MYYHCLLKLKGKLFCLVQHVFIVKCTISRDAREQLVTLDIIDAIECLLDLTHFRHWGHRCSTVIESFVFDSDLVTLVSSPVSIAIIISRSQIEMWPSRPSSVIRDTLWSNAPKMLRSDDSLAQIPHTYSGAIVISVWFTRSTDGEIGGTGLSPGRFIDIRK